MKLINAIAKETDKQLLSKHIGEYQIIYFYHTLKSKLSKGDPNQKRERGNHIAILKKKLGRIDTSPIGKQFCEKLIEYYESV